MKLKCNAIQSLISDYIDDTLNKNDVAKVETHLQFCTKCQREIAAIRKTRDLVIDYYVEPVASENYFHQFEVELHRSLQKKGPTSLNQRLKTSAAQFLWCLLTQLRQSISKYNDTRMNTLTVGALLLLIVSGFVATHFLNQEISHPPKVYLNGAAGGQIADGETDIDDQQKKSLHQHRTNWKDSSEVSSPALTANVEKEGYWRLSQPLANDTEEHIIFIHISNDRSAPGDTDSEVVVYEEPTILERKSPLQEDYVALPLDLHVDPFSEKHPRKQRKLSGFVVKLIHLPTEMLTIPEFYDLIKL